jgi:hypothetical protein
MTYNAFCAGHTQGKDGSIWMVGGDAQSSNKTDGTTFLYDGRNRIRTYTPASSASGIGAWSEDNTMTGGNRWYPTAVTMGNGE